MKKIYLFILIMVAVTRLYAQNDAIKSFSDLPTLRFQTEAIKNHDTTAIENWLKNIAATGIVHIDSVLIHAVILDTGTWVWLIRLKAMYQFAENDWKNLIYADTVFKHMQQVYYPLKITGITEIASYAKAMLDSGKNLSAAHLNFFKQSIYSLNKNDKEGLLGFILGRMNNAQAMYETELKKASDSTFIADTSLYFFLRG